MAMAVRSVFRGDTIKFSKKLLHRFHPSIFETGNSSTFTSYSKSTLQPANAATVDTHGGYDHYENMDWDKLGFSILPTDYMYVMELSRDGSYTQGRLNPYGNIELSPAAGVLNYGQGIFEGLKAYRKTDGSLSLFRPKENALRMRSGADRLCMPSPSIDQFLDAVKTIVLANKRWVPPTGKGSLYVRPLLMGSGPILGLSPAPTYTFLIYTSPVGNYFKEGLSPINLVVEAEVHRATPGGTGSVKAIGNYAPVIQVQLKAKAKGYTDVIFLDSQNQSKLEEVSSCNIFSVKGNSISTPATEGTILPGITRKSIIDVARDFGYEVQERPVFIEEVLEADEVFCTGTAVVVAPVGSITYRGKRFEYKNGIRSVSQQIYSTLTGIQMGTIQDKKGWTVEID